MWQPIHGVSPFMQKTRLDQHELHADASWCSLVIVYRILVLADYPSRTEKRKTGRKASLAGCLLITSRHYVCHVVLSLERTRFEVMSISIQSRLLLIS